MIHESDKKKIKLLFSDWNEIIDEKKETSKNINKVLKSNREYQELITQKKELIESIKEKKQSVIGPLHDEEENLKANLRTIVSDVTESLEISSSMVNTLFRFYKKKFDHGIDELDMIVMKYLEIFQGDEDEEGKE